MRRSSQLTPLRRPHHSPEALASGPRRISSLRLGPNLYLAQTMPGLESVAAEEIASQYALARDEQKPGGDMSDAPKRRSPRAIAPREITRRTVPDRSGMTIFTAPRPEPLGRLRTVEDVFAIVGYYHAQEGALLPLERVPTIARDAPYVAYALEARTRLMPGTRSGHKLRFRVIARMVGEQAFRRIDLKRAIERGLAERLDHSWRLSEDEADVEFWANLLDNELILTVRLSDERMRQRDYKIAHLPGSLRPSIAAALAWISRPEPEDIVLDPMCGTGTILIERAHLRRHHLLLGSDRNPVALTAARENIGPRYKPLELHPWDATAIPLPDASVSRIITNMPWGIRHGSHPENRRNYPRMIEEFNRLVRPGGRVVVLTGESSLMNNLIARGMFQSERIMRVSILGADAVIYTWKVPG